MSEKRPPPYFPQTSLSPTDENRYRKFKLIIGISIIGLLLILAAAGFGIYYLVSWIMG